jgi:hypothetical protein
MGKNGELNKEAFLHLLVDKHNHSGIQCRGVVIHRLLRTFEALSSGLQEQGLAKRQADRIALRAALQVEGWSDDEARMARNRLLPPV